MDIVEVSCGLLRMLHETASKPEMRHGVIIQNLNSIHRLESTHHSCVPSCPATLTAAMLASPLMLARLGKLLPRLGL